jgi:Short C-terminal domain
MTSDDEHPDDARLARLERLGQLQEKGLLTPAEFQEEKKRILSG